MKYIMFLLAIILCFNTWAQGKNGNSDVFIRVYDLEDKKLNKGKVVTFSDTTLQISKSGETIDIPINRIGKIKTKRSTGHNVLVGTGIGSATAAILGATSSKNSDEFIEYSAGEGFAIGTIVGAPFGAAIGGITALFKNSETFIIDGNAAKWEEFMNSIKH